MRARRLQLFLQPCVLAKQLEFRWFHENYRTIDDGRVRGNVSRCALRHNMPFLPRTLSYIRPNISRNKREELPGSSSDKDRCIDLLFSVFGHRTAHTNPVLLPVSCVLPEEISKGSLGMRKKKFSSVIARADDATGPSFGSSFARINDKEASCLETNAQKVVSSHSHGFYDEKADAKVAALIPIKVFFHYNYLGVGSLPSFFIETREDHRCPFCFFDTVRQLDCADLALHHEPLWHSLVSLTGFNFLFAFLERIDNGLWAAIAL